MQAMLLDRTGLFSFCSSASLIWKPSTFVQLINTASDSGTSVSSTSSVIRSAVCVRSSSAGMICSPFMATTSMPLSARNSFSFWLMSSV